VQITTEIICYIPVNTTLFPVGEVCCLGHVSAYIYICHIEVSLVTVIIETEPEDGILVPRRVVLVRKLYLMGILLYWQEYNKHFIQGYLYICTFIFVHLIG
jgi:hypothetical protein